MLKCSPAAACTIFAVAAFCSPITASAQSITPATQEAACNADNAAACVALGIRLTDADGIAKDERRGANLFLKACNLGNGQACMLWGYALETGRGAYVNLPQAAAYYKNSCDLGNAVGCNNHGQMYRFGRGEGKNETLALGLLAKSCRLQFAVGCLNEGVLHADATTLRSNRTLAVAAFDKGCVLGNSDSCNKQAWHVEQGLGARRDRDEAVRLYTIACNGGYELGCQNAQRITGSRPAQPSSASSQTASSGAMSYMSCHAYIRASNKLFVAPVISAASERSNELALAYAQLLREKGYAGLTAYDPPGTPLPVLSPFCIVEPTQARAEAKKQALLRGAATGRTPMRVLQTEFNPQ